jgi:hypothetical protein
MDPDEPRLRVDFNDADDSDIIRTLRRNATPNSIGVGDQVRLYDDEGNAALGCVETADAKTVSVKVIWSTWIDGNPPEPTLSDDLMEALRRQLPIARPATSETAAVTPEREWWK